MYYLGIDGGGTRTTAVVTDEKGNIITKKTGGTINFVVPKAMGNCVLKKILLDQLAA